MRPLELVKANMVNRTKPLIIVSAVLGSIISLFLGVCCNPCIPRFSVLRLEPVGANGHYEGSRSLAI